MKIKQFVKKFGQPYSKQLGIKINSEKNSEICKWFLASILYAKPIQESCATKTYKCFEKYGVLLPRKILSTGWDGLVKILDEGSYTRYDFSTADKLLDVFGNLQKKYAGNLNKLYEKTKNAKDLELKLKSFGKGIGNTTISIFLREMRDVWPKADPIPSKIVKLAMENLGIKNLKEFAKKKSINLTNLETALLRLGKDFCKKRKCANCPVKRFCKIYSWFS